ncbi:hypothetical protein MTO96_047958 [Rhipicephalus appendiculatus]
MATPDRLIRQGLRATRPREQEGHAPTGQRSPPVDGPSPESLSPSPPYVRVHDLAALPPQRNRTSRGGERGQRHSDGTTENPQRQDERLCIILWVVGTALAFPLVLSAWLLFVPYLVRANWSTPPSYFSMPPYIAPTVSSTPSTPAAVPVTSANPKAERSCRLSCACALVKAATKSQRKRAILVRAIERKLEAHILPLQQYARLRLAKHHEQLVELRILDPAIRIVPLRSLLVGGHRGREPDEPTAELRRTVWPASAEGDSGLIQF